MSNFICEKCGMTNIDCGKQGYKTEREIELEKQLDREIHINRIMKRALKDISEQFDKIDFGDFEEIFICKTSRIALKQIEEME